MSFGVMLLLTLLLRVYPYRTGILCPTESIYRRQHLIPYVRSLKVPFHVLFDLGCHRFERVVSLMPKMTSLRKLNIHFPLSLSWMLQSSSLPMLEEGEFFLIDEESTPSESEPVERLWEPIIHFLSSMSLLRVLNLHWPEDASRHLDSLAFPRLVEFTHSYFPCDQHVVSFLARCPLIDLDRYFPLDLVNTWPFHFSWSEIPPIDNQLARLLQEDNKDAHPHLFRHVLIDYRDNIWHSSHLIALLASNTTIAAYVKNFVLVCYRRDLWSPLFQSTLVSALANMTGLRTLTLRNEHRNGPTARGEALCSAVLESLPPHTVFTQLRKFDCSFPLDTALITFLERTPQLEDLRIGSDETQVREFPSDLIPRLVHFEGVASAWELVSPGRSIDLHVLHKVPVVECGWGSGTWGDGDRGSEEEW